MKVEIRGFYGLEIIAENDAERIWFMQFLEVFSNNYSDREKTNITVDLESMCRMENRSSATELTIAEAVQEDGCWGMVDKISLNAGGL